MRLSRRHLFTEQAALVSCITRFINSCDRDVFGSASPHWLLRLKHVAVVSKWPSFALHKKKQIALLCCSSPAFTLVSPLLHPTSPSKPNDPHLCLIGSAPFQVYLNPLHLLFCARLAAPGVYVILVHIKDELTCFCAPSVILLSETVFPGG